MKNSWSWKGNTSLKHLCWVTPPGGGGIKEYEIRCELGIKMKLESLLNNTLHHQDNMQIHTKVSFDVSFKCVYNFCFWKWLFPWDLVTTSIYSASSLRVVPNTTPTLKCAKNKKVGNKNIVNLFWTKRANKNNTHLYKLCTFEVPKCSILKWLAVFR